MTQAQAILLGLNCQAQVEVTPLETDLRDQYPVFFSDYRRHAQRYAGGDWWFFREAQPWLIGAMVRDAGGGITRLRYLEQVLMTLRRDWQRESLQSLAIAPLGDSLEWVNIQPILQEHLSPLPLPILVYHAYIPHQKADEPPLVEAKD